MLFLGNMKVGCMFKGTGCRSSQCRQSFTFESLIGWQLIAADIQSVKTMSFQKKWFPKTGNHFAA
jgi:hypothetical protein